MAQPMLSSDRGVILSIGILANGERAEIVLPIATDNVGLDTDTMCDDAVTAFAGAGLQPELLACLSSDASITFYQAVGMVLGTIPSRNDFSPGSIPGTSGAGAMPTNVAGLIAFYAETVDLGVGRRERVGKNFIPGISVGDVIENNVTPGLFTALQTLGSDLVLGWATTLAGGNWYRVNAASHVAGQSLTRNHNALARGYIGTQRRRLLPR